MNARHQIIWFQALPEVAWRLFRSITSRMGPKDVARKRGDKILLKDITTNQNKALLAFPPHVIERAKAQWPNIRHYNYTGLVHSLVSALNKSGYSVDLVDPARGPLKLGSYDCFVGHGGHCGWILSQLQSETIVYEYVSGAHWKSFMTESQSRYERFCKKHRLPLPEDYRRSMRDLCEGHQQLHDRADTMFTIMCPRMVENYGKLSVKFHMTGLGAYLDPLFKVDEELKDYKAGRKNFIYVGGTGGNIQKGLDLLLEAFAARPNLNLFIYCKVESEILNHCRNELAKPNIHYVYHWRFRPFHQRLKKLLQRTNYTVHAPMNFGMGTAFMASMGSGLIPCGYVDVPDPDNSTVLTQDWRPDSIADCLDQAASKKAEWCAKAAAIAKERYQQYCDPLTVEKEFTAMFGGNTNSQPHSE